MYGDNLTNITSVCAIVISIISIVFTTTFSILQVKHNKNRVRPIASILLNDYENLLSVYIENVGTGPLTITKLTCSDGFRKENSLIELLPTVNQNWSTFCESIDGRTIPVGGQVVLVEIQPQDEKIRSKIRAALSKIEVSVEYSDIYNSKFIKRRKLSYFGRHSLIEYFPEKGC